jgi:hypothetical protein
MSDHGEKMTVRPAKPFYFDVLARKHESYVYDEADASIVEVEHEGRSIKLLTLRHRLPVSFRVTASQGDVLFLLGEELDFEDEDGRIEGGDGVLVVALKLADRVDTYWALAWHNLFSYTMERLDRPEA